MEGVYENEVNRQLPQQPVVVPKSSTGLMGWIQSNKIIVLVVIIILIALIWWFCIRKKGEVTVENGGVSATIPSGTKVHLNRGSAY